MKCSTCERNIQSLDDFRDVLSFKEFKISGCCQSCQDEVFCDLYTGATTCNKPCCKDEEDNS